MNQRVHTVYPVKSKRELASLLLLLLLPCCCLAFPFLLSRFLFLGGNIREHRENRE